MTVKNLIRLLEKCDLNVEVRVGTYCGTVDGNIKGISVDQLTPSHREHCMYLECEIEHYNGERIQWTYPTGEPHC
jgi:hypothetical protein